MDSESLSPWGMAPLSALRIFPLHGKAVKGELAIPGSKSFTNRALLLAAVAKGQTHLSNVLLSDDSYWCVETLKALGRSVNMNSARQEAVIEGGTFKIQENAQTYIGSAGTTARFLPGLIAARGLGRVTLKASEQLAARPLRTLVEALRGLGADITFANEEKSFPLHIQGGTLVGGEVSISGAKSSQFLSGLLMAAPLAQKETIITVVDHVVQADYVRMTLALMQDFGVNVDVSADFKRFAIAPQNYQARDLALEADASTATYFFALGAGSGGEVTVTNLNAETLQPDFLFVRALEKMGAEVKIEGTHITVRGPKQLQGNMTFDFKPCSDSTPSLIALSPFASGDIEVRGVAHIRAHESDRLDVMRETLEKAGVAVIEFEDGLKVSPSLPCAVTVDPHDDHRMAMAFSVMGALGSGAIIQNPACVSKTCPDFFNLLRQVGVDWERL